MKPAMIVFKPKRALAVGVFLLLAIVSTTAQNNLHFQKDDLGVRFHVDGLINNINLTPATDPNGNVLLSLRKFVKDDLAISAGFGIQSFNENPSTVDSLGTFRREFDSTASKFDFYVTPGVEKYFFVSERFTPYVGTNVSIGALGKLSQSGTTQLIDTTGTRRIEVTDDRPGGFDFGVNFNLGFEYFIAKKLSLGANYRFGYLVARRGGDFNRVTVDTPITGSTIITRNVGSDISRTRGFYFSNNVSLSLSYFFNVKKNEKK